MGMTMSQKILAKKAGRSFVAPGDLIETKLDLCLANDITGPVAVKEFEKAGFTKVWDREKVVFALDHFTPNKDIKSAEHSKFIREFAKKHELVNYFEGGNCGVEHSILPERGLVVGGDMVIGADSHTCTYGALGAFSTGVGSTDMAAGMARGIAWIKVPSAIEFNLTGRLGEYVSGKDLILYIIGKIGVDGALYKSMEFTGEGISSLTMDDRLTVANMAIEAGGKNGIFECDGQTAKFITDALIYGGHIKNAEEAKGRYEFYSPDADAEYERTMRIDLSKLAPMVAYPHLPSNTKDVFAAQKDKIKLDQVVIGSCTNGRLSDFETAAKIIKGKKVISRTLIIPTTPKIYMEALKLGYLETFLEAGAIVSPPTCGPCLGGHMGILANGEKALATTNRNFVGRMGHPGSEVYLASPAVAAASAVTGFITAPPGL